MRRWIMQARSAICEIMAQETIAERPSTPSIVPRMEEEACSSFREGKKDCQEDVPRLIYVYERRFGLKELPSILGSDRGSKTRMDHLR